MRRKKNMKRMKKLLALLLAVCVSIPTAAGTLYSGTQIVQAGEAAEQDLIFEKENVSVTSGSPADLSSESYASDLFAMEEGTIIVRYTSTSTYAVQTLFSIANGTTGNNNRHFHVYITPAGRLGCEIRNDTGLNYHIYADNAVNAGKENAIALKADMANSEYKLFANGKLIATVDAQEKGGFKFVNDITGVDTVQIGATKRGGSAAYMFGGTVHSIRVYGTALSDEEILEALPAGETELGDGISEMFDASYRDNTWVFTGGEAVQGGFDQTRGIRNYIGQFEEYIRWTLGGSSPVNGRQRFTFNTGKAGNTLSDVVDNYDRLVADLETKAAVYMVGVEDYSQGTEKLDEFKADLKTFIDNSLALKENNGGFAVIQKPFAVKDDAANALIQEYCDAVDTVAAGYEHSEKYAHIVVVDHFTQTNTAEFKENNLQENGKLNAQGHLEIGRQFAEATEGLSGTYPCPNVTLDRVEEEQPEEYMDVQPAVTATASSLQVVIPEEVGTRWKYELDMEGTTVSGTAEGSSFEITGLAEGKSYVLKIQSQDGTKQLVTTKGVVTEGNQAVKNTQVLDENQQKIADMVNGDQPMTWLFMGDSITHASRYTYGYDGIVQIFEKYVREELGRVDDIVLNTAVANADSVTTLQELDQRLEKFTPDVVSIMLGTNDASSKVDITADQFEANMRLILNKIQEINPNAVIILRSPTPVFDANRLPYIDSYISKIQNLAEEYGTIYIDQYTELKEATGTYSAWLKAALFPDSLHPDANGQRILAYKFIKACGIWTEDSEMTNLFYDMSIEEEANSLIPEVTSYSDQIMVSAEKLEADSGLQIGDVILRATSENSGQTYEISAKDADAYAALRNLPGDTAYNVEVAVYLKNAAKKVTFGSQRITLGDDSETVLLKAGSISASDENVTQNQPFASGTAGSSLFRIPAIITLKNGEILATADARWTGGADWGGLDTIASVSDDGGETWHYSFPIYFPDSNTIYPGREVATTAIDPVIVQGPDGTIYCIADMNPSGITTGDIMPSTGTGFVEIDGKWRLALTGTYTKPNASDLSTYGNPENYEYYVGDFDENGFAPVLNKSDNSATEWGVDRWYNIYTVNGQTGAYEATLVQTMVNDVTLIQQNAFYKDSILHVFNTGYLWLVTSDDNGRTWENPQILNPQIKRGGEVALLASPGQGLVTSGGDIIIPFYDHGDGVENASIIWSDDNGQTWNRSNDVSGMWSSESEIVELNNGVLRMFFRNGTGYICYADITKADGVWTMGTGIQTSIPVCSTCNVTAIRYSKKINDKLAVMVACPGGSGRANGKIFTFLVDADNSMELFNTFSVNEGTYAYSCMTELQDGNIGLLWENAGTAIRYDELQAEEVLGLVKNITINTGQEYVEKTTADTAKQITKEPDEAVASVTSELVTEDKTTLLHDHISNTASSLDSFSAAAGTNNVEEAEFTFTANGDYWRIYNEAKGVYLTNDNAASTFFSGTAADMKAEAVDGKFRISKSDGTRYVIFYFTNMDFNSNKEYKNPYTEGIYELVLLEKQEMAAEDDVIPGYRPVSEITSGKKYLISYLWGTDTETEADDGVIILYPTNGTGNQTKLVGDTVEITRNVLTITGIAPGTTSVIVDSVTYNITVRDPADDPSYSGRDIPVSALKPTAGSEDDNTEQGPAANALDGNVNTYWHTDWDGCDRSLHWIQFEVEDGYMTDGLRYLPRPDAGNGVITKYEIKVSDNGTDWTTVASGDWALDNTWKKADFEAQKVKYVRLVSIESKGIASAEFTSAAEIRLTGTKITEPVDPDPDPDPDPNPNPELPYIDVKEGDWFYDYVYDVYVQELMTGLEETIFGPGQKLARAQFALILYRMEGEPGSDYANPFPDVPADSWYTDAVLWAAKAGIVTGYTGTGKFGPADDITREQMAAMMYRYAKYKNLDTTDEKSLSAFPDGDRVQEFAVDGMEWCTAKGIISGKGEEPKILDPQGSTVRAECAAIISRYVKIAE